MRKPVVLAAVGIVLVVLAILGAFFLNNRKKATPQRTEQTVDAALPSTTLAEFTDSSGISFRYPDDLSVSASKNLDDATYAQIQITSIDYPGSIIVRAADETASSFDIWIKGNAKLASAKSSQDAKLADLIAKKFVTTDSTLTAVLDQGVLFTVEVFPQKNQAYWNSAYDTLISSFTIVVPQAAPTTSSTNDTASTDDVVFEGEEVIE